MSKSASTESARRMGLIRWLGWGRLLLVPPMIGAVVLIWWSVKRLAPVQQEIAKITASISRLNSEIENMESDLREAGGEQGIEDCFRQAEEQLLPGRPGIEAWSKEMEQAALVHGLEMSISFGKPESRSVTNYLTTLVPADLVLRPRADLPDDRSAYQRVLDLAETVVNTGHRIDLVQLEARGASNSVGYARMTLHLWTTTLQSDTQ